MIIYYKVIIVWSKYPFQDEVDEKYCEFYTSKVKRKVIEGLRMDSNTSIQEKEAYLKEKLNLKRVTVKKLK